MNKMSEEELFLFNKLHDRSVELNKSLNSRRIRGFKESRINKYTQSAHFVYELLQNADDAGATEACFYLFRNQLIFKHNGLRHFDITDDYEEDWFKPVGDINAIVSFEDSPKLSNDSPRENKIGKFGIGFKAVYQYTDVPEIYDDKFKFKIEETIIPSLLVHDHPLRKEGETLFVLPFKNLEKDYDSIRNRLINLSSPVLFLHHLNRVIWKDMDDENIEHVYSKSIEKTIPNKLKIHFRIEQEDNQEKTKRIFMFSRIISLGNAGNQRISVGYYINGNNNWLEINNRPRLFCFFQLGCTLGLPIIAHAPFLTTDNRDGLKPDSEFNDLLLNELARLAADALVLIRDYSEQTGRMYLNNNIFDIIPYNYVEHQYEENKPLHGESFNIQVFYNHYTKRVLGEKLILGEDRMYHAPIELLMANESLRSLVSKKQLAILMGGIDKAFIRNFKFGNQLNYVEHGLGIGAFTNEDFANSLSEEFMQHQDKRWIQELYEYIKKENLFQLFSDKPIVPVQDGSWTYAKKNGEQNVYLPFEYDKINSDKKPFKYVALDYLNERRDFFEKLGLKVPGITDYIQKELVPNYLKALDEGQEDKALYYLKQIINKWNKISFGGEDVSWTDYWTTKGFLKQTLLLKVKDDNQYCQCDSLLVVTDQGLLDYYSTVGAVQLLDIDYYHRKLHDIGKQEILSFITRIGLEENASIIFLSKTLERGRNGGLKHVRNYQLKFWEECCITKESSSLIWKELINSKKNDYESVFMRYWKYDSASSGAKCNEDGFSDLYTQLIDTAWIYVDEETHVRPTDILPDDFHRLGYNEDRSIEIILGLGLEAQRKKDEEEELQRRQQEINEREEHERVLEAARNEERDRTFSLFDDGQSLLDGTFQESPNRRRNVRKMIKYIGVRLCQYLFRGEDWESSENEELYDFKYKDSFIAVSAVNVSIKENGSPIYLTIAQHHFMKSCGHNQFHIIRVSLQDLGIDFESNIRNLYGEDADIDTDEQLRKACDRLVAQYWSSASVEDFKRACPEYSISIHKEM